MYNPIGTPPLIPPNAIAPVLRSVWGFKTSELAHGDIVALRDELNDLVRAVTDVSADAGRDVWAVIDLCNRAIKEGRRLLVAGP
jgi:hypothetical protein